MRLTYIYHSCYLIEFQEFNILIDFYEDSKDPTHGEVHNRILAMDKPLYILCSHHHHDHYNPEILEWQEIYNGKVVYIFSSDIRNKKLAEQKDIIFLKKDSVFEDNLINIKAFGSTDEGISFLIKTKTQTIFHAGDLNNWHWREESTIEESKEYEANFLKELDDLAREVQLLDLAMFPIDPRLGNDYALGAKQFLYAIETKVMAPMHFQENYGAIAQFAEDIQMKNCQLFIPDKRGDSIQL